MDKKQFIGKYRENFPSSAMADKVEKVLEKLYFDGVEFDMACPVGNADILRFKSVEGNTWKLVVHPTGEINLEISMGLPADKYLDNVKFFLEELHKEKAFEEGVAKSVKKKARIGSDEPFTDKPRGRK